MRFTISEWMLFTFMWGATLSGTLGGPERQNPLAVLFGLIGMVVLVASLNKA
jgi:hypothetical protein